MTVRTRFAPSPTGYLHIGGVRTALFNWLFARKHGGQFILRIDDTDQGRNQPEALQPILDGFKWLGLNWDEGPEVGGPCGPYYQSQKLDRYQAAVKALLDKGLAYWDYATAEETDAERCEHDARVKAKAATGPFIYSRRWMAETDADRAKFEAEGRKGSVKIKMPRTGACRFKDHVRSKRDAEGNLENLVVEWAGEQDIVIQRSDGTVTYNLANVVDDFDMKITHVIRAEEHLSNTPRQIFMLEGLGYPRPEYAHVPFVAEPGSKNKLSKRKIPQYLKNDDFKKVYNHAKCIADRIGVPAAPESFNPVLVDFYKQVGYLPAALLNALVLYGWALDGTREDFTLAQMTELFSLDHVISTPASLDVKKLFAFQGKYMQAVLPFPPLPVAEKVEMVLPFLARAKLVADANAARPFVTRVVEAAGPRMTVAGDILEYDYLFLADEQINFDPAMATKHLTEAFKKKAQPGEPPPPPTVVPPLAEMLKKLRAVVAGAEPFTHDNLKAVTEALAASEGAKVGPLSQVLRVATTGKEVGFSAYDTLALLGRDRCLSRIDRAMR